jgi:hypothetical protein
MKKILFLLTLVLFSGFVAKAQDNDNEKIRDKMKEFIQRRLKLSNNEADRFTPVFIRYFRDWRQTVREHKDDILFRQQKIAELRIRYRDEFRDVVGEKRSTEVYKKQEEFIRILNDQMRTRRDDRINRKNIP